MLKTKRIAKQAYHNCYIWIEWPRCVHHHFYQPLETIRSQEGQSIQDSKDQFRNGQFERCRYLLPLMLEIYEGELEIYLTFDFLTKRHTYEATSLHSSSLPIFPIQSPIKPYHLSCQIPLVFIDLIPLKKTVSLQDAVQSQIINQTNSNIHVKLWPVGFEFQHCSSLFRPTRLIRIVVNLNGMMHQSLTIENSSGTLSTEEVIQFDLQRKEDHCPQWKGQS